MATKKKMKADAPGPETIGPEETTIDKGPDEVPEVKAQEPVQEPEAQDSNIWQCPHCSTFYRKDMKVAQRNHLARHGVPRG